MLTNRVSIWIVSQEAHIYKTWVVVHHYKIITHTWYNDDNANHVRHFMLLPTGLFSRLSPLRWTHVPVPMYGGAVAHQTLTFTIYTHIACTSICCLPYNLSIVWHGHVRTQWRWLVPSNGPSGCLVCVCMCMDARGTTRSSNTHCTQQTREIEERANTMTSMSNLAEVLVTLALLCVCVWIRS